MNPIRRISMCVVVAALAVLPLAQVADAKTEAPDVPDDVQVEEGHKVFLVGHAIGVQIYRCNAAGDGFAWGLVAPRADLYDDHGKLIVTHYGGPTWEARDGSTVVAARDGQVNVDPNAIPWLKLKATSTSPGSDGDRLVKTAFIQRVATTGGLAPAAANCNAATAGEQGEVPYTADYYFWK
jgi:hypothetical protein